MLSAVSLARNDAAARPRSDAALVTPSGEANFSKHLHAITPASDPASDGELIEAALLAPPALAPPLSPPPALPLAPMDDASLAAVATDVLPPPFSDEMAPTEFALPAPTSPASIDAAAPTPTPDVHHGPGTTRASATDDVHPALPQIIAHAPMRETTNARNATITNVDTTPTLHTQTPMTRKAASEPDLVSIKDKPPGPESEALQALKTSDALPIAQIAGTESLSHQSVPFDDAAAPSPLAIVAPPQGNSTPQAAAAALNSPQTLQAPVPQYVAPLEKLPHILKTALSEGDDTANRIVVQLDPPELGRVSLDFSFDAQGLQTVTVTAETPEAVRKLRAMYFELVQALEQRGLSGENLTFSQERPRQERPQFEAHAARASDSAQIAVARTDALSIPILPLRSTSDGLDLKL